MGFVLVMILLVCEFATSYVLRLGKLFFLAVHKPYHHYALPANFGLKAKFSFACHHLASSKIYLRKINYRQICVLA